MKLATEDLPRRRDHRRLVVPHEIRHAHRGALVPGHGPDGREVRLHHEVAVALLPRRHRVALDRVHLHIDREQVVAGLGVVLEHLLDEVLADEPLALQAALHVGEDEEDRVDGAIADRAAELIGGHAPRSSDSAELIASNSFSGAEDTWWWRE